LELKAAETHLRVKGRHPMNEPQSVAEVIRAGIAERLAPLFDDLRKVESQIETKEAELAELRAVRTELRRTLAPYDDSIARPGGRRNGGKPKPTGKQGKGNTGQGVSDEKVNTLRDFIEANYEQGDDIHSTALEDAGLNMYRGGIVHGLDVLAERGVIRLDRRARIGERGAPSKVYRRVGAD